jgi:quercetin dioxygenase-like cupin family protein
MKNVENDFVIDDPTRNAPQHYRTRMENERVRVLEYHSKPGDKSALHSHPESVVYSLSQAQMRITAPDGTHKDITLEPGEVILQPETVHALQNVGETEAHLLVVELKAPVEPIPLV